MRKLLLLSALASIIAINAATAEASKTSYGARNAAEIKCYQFMGLMERSPTGSEQQFYTWAQGYFVGRASLDNSVDALPDDGPERDKVFQKFVSYCEENSEHRFIDAVIALSDQS